MSQIPLDQNNLQENSKSGEEETIPNIFPINGITANLYKTPEGILVFQQKILGGTDEFSVKEFLKETQSLFHEIAHELQQSNNYPNFIVDYRGCKLGSIDLKILQIEVGKLFEGVTNKEKALLRRKLYQLFMLLVLIIYS
jgi:hypothetical protein